jgi:helix-turn-helix protein
MASRIGSDLRRARTRREIDLTEVEAATRIRGRFLRAIEDEEWDVLPGGVYTRGFIRTYASFLGLDGERLAEDYRREVEGGSPAAEATPVVDSPPPRRRRRFRGGRLPAVAGIATVAALGAVAVFAFPGGDGSQEPASGPSGTAANAPARPETATPSGSRRTAAGVSLQLTATAEVWVCVIGAGGRRLVDGQILEAGAAAGPFRSDSFTVSFGNGEVTMLIDGERAQIPATSNPIGYSVDPSGALARLSEAERPTCA